MKRGLGIAAMASLVVSLSASAALCVDKDKEKEAQAAFVEAMKLMGTKRYAEACEKFARSQELDPGMGTQFRLAECYEKLGRLASAYEQYTAVAEAAKGAKKKERELVARRRASSLEAQVAKLTIDIAPTVAAMRGLEVRRDGALVPKDLWGSSIPVDSGDHLVTVTAPGKQTFERKVWAEGAAKLLVSVAGLEEPPVAKSKPRPKLPAIVLGVVGGAGLIVGGVFLGQRASQKRDAEGQRDTILTNGGSCAGGVTAEWIDACSALSRTTRTCDTYGTISLVSFLIGGAALGGMATYLLWPEARPSAVEAKERSRPLVSPVFGPGFGGLTARLVF